MNYELSCRDCLDEYQAEQQYIINKVFLIRAFYFTEGKGAFQLSAEAIFPAKVLSVKLQPKCSVIFAPYPPKKAVLLGFAQLWSTTSQKSSGSPGLL